MKNLICVCIVFFLSVTGCTKEPEKQEKAPSTAGSDIAAETTLLATISDDEKPQSVAPSSGLGLHPSLSAVFQVIFSERGGGVAYIAEKNGKVYVVHNGRAGRQYASVGTAALSADGRRIAYGALADGKWRMVIDGKEGESYNTLGTPVLSPGGLHVAYQAMKGEQWLLVVDNTENSGTQARYTSQEFSADSTRIAYVESADDKNKGRLVVSDLAFKKQKVMESGGALMITNAGKTRIAAVSKSGDKQRVIEFSFDRPDDVKKGPLYDAIHNLAFSPDGVSLAYHAARAGKLFCVLNGREDLLPDGAPVGPPVVRPDNKVVGAIITSNNAAFLHQAFLDSGQKEKEYDEAANLVYSRDGRFHAYAARKGENWFAVVNGREGPAFDRVVSPVFSPDGKLLVYRARKDEKRFVVVANASGKTLRQHPSYEQVFPVVFTGDGKSIAYGVKDGNMLIWKVEGI